MSRRLNELPEWPDARGWIAVGCFILVLVVLAMVAIWPWLLKVDAFLILATAIVITGWVQGPVGWAYQATKSGGDLAERNSETVAAQAQGATNNAATPFVPTDAKDAAQATADAAQDTADDIAGHRP